MARPLDVRLLGSARGPGFENADMLPALSSVPPFTAHEPPLADVAVGAERLGAEVLAQMATSDRRIFTGDVRQARIMIVDDETVIVKMVRKCLQTIGYAHFITDSGSDETIEIIRREQPDVVLLDIMLQGINGLYILCQVRRDPDLYHIPVLILTGNGDAVTKRVSLESGATDFLEKPVNPAELASRIRNALVVKAHHDHLTNYAEELEQEVARRTDELVATKEQAQLRYLAGKAEVATSVLHNVGNALHSINVSVNLISERLRESKLPFLERTVQMFQEHAADLGTFLGSDPRGQKLLPYLLDLGKVLEREREKTMRDVESLSRHLEHIKAIVATQQEYARLRNVVEPIALATVVQDAESLLGASIEKSGIEIVREFADFPLVKTDKQKLIQVLVNLLKNAVESCRQAHKGGGGRVTIHLADAGEAGATITVRDNGVGIAADSLNKIFTHGFTTKKDGHGFGLHSAANTVRELGGTIRVHSDGLGLGAGFVVGLPWQAEKGDS